MKRKTIIAAVVAIVLAASAALAVYVSKRNSNLPAKPGLGALDGETAEPVRGGIQVPEGGIEEVRSDAVDYGGLYNFFDVAGTLAYPYQDGAYDVMQWYALEPTTGQYTWATLDNWVNDRASHSLHIGLGFDTTDYDPWYCANQGGSQCWSASDPRGDRILLPADLIEPQDEGVTYVVCPLDTSAPRHRLPKYWSTQYKTAYANFANALADYIVAAGLDEKIDWVEIPVGVYGEYNPGRSEDRPCFFELGLTQDMWETTVRWMIDTWVDAFAGTGIDLFFEGSNYYVDKGDRERTNDYAASQGVGLQHARWHPDEEDMNVLCNGCWSFGKGIIDHILRAENQVPFQVEVPDHPLAGDAHRTALNNAEEDYWAMAFFLDLKGDVYKARTVDRGNLKRITYENPHVVQMIQTLHDLAGKDETDAPYAVVWMRETEADSVPWWPKCGNFEFYLSASTAQLPNPGSSCKAIANLTLDGQAVAVTDLDETYAPGTCPNAGTYPANCDPRYRYARQTRAGHPYIYLDVAPTYRYGAGIDADIEIEYLDLGTDQISFQWYGPSGLQTETIAKTNTRQWRTWQLRLQAMDLRDRFISGSTAWDFCIADLGDGIETIHSVKFAPSNGAVGNTPTPTRTPTSTPAPTATPWLLRIDASNSAWSDAQIYAATPDAVSTSSTAVNPRANTTDGAAVPTEYPTTKRSVLYSVPFAIPTSATVNRATLYLAPKSFGGGPIVLKLRKILARWNAPSWNSRTTAGTPTLWTTPGAYGATDAGAVFREYMLDASVLDQDVVALDVTGAVQPSGGLALKIEPWCTPSAVGGSCASGIMFGAIESQNLGDRPYLEVDLVSSTAPTATPTPYGTPTPVRTSTPTPTRTTMPAPTTTATRTSTPYPPSLREGLVINELCSNPVTTDNIPDGVIDGDAAVELYNSSPSARDLSDYRLCVNGTCLWLEGTVQPFGYEVYYEKWDGLNFNAGGQNAVRLEQMGQPPTGLVDSLTIQSQAPDLCWATLTDASQVYVEKWPPTLGRGNSYFEPGNHPTPTTAP